LSVTNRIEETIKNSNNK